MQVIYPRCAGLDVHQKTVVVTIMITAEEGTVQREQQTFLTMTEDLLALDEWLRQHQVEVIVHNRIIRRTGMHPFEFFNSFFKCFFCSLGPFFCFCLFLEFADLAFIGISAQFFLDAF